MNYAFTFALTISVSACVRASVCVCVSLSPLYLFYLNFPLGRHLLLIATLDFRKRIPAKCIHDLRPRQQPCWLRVSCVIASRLVHYHCISFHAITLVVCGSKKKKNSRSMRAFIA
ncbi:hypothetical protein EDB89DRAFT_259008 [Lactarius sanguifluus]|nr:hypothetical protein EDB89DRAFT_259008 [Lactarius sanguifluus]